MMKFLLMFLAISLFSSPVVAEEMRPDDFAEGYYLLPDQDYSIHSVTLPQDIYSTVIRPYLGDMQVFNGAGERVPSLVKTVEADMASLRLKEPVPFFPLYQATSILNRERGLSVRIERDKQGEIVDIYHDSDRNMENPRLIGYLLDLGDLEAQSAELELFWNMDNEPSLFSVTIQQSDDLETWTKLVGIATLVSLDYAGERIEKRIIPLRLESKQYLKLLFHPQPVDLKLEKILSYSNELPGRRQLYWREVEEQLDLEEEGVFAVEIELKEQIKTESIQLRFNEANSMVNGRLFSKDSKDGVWVRRCEKVFYSLLIDSKMLRNGACFFSGNRDRFWRFETEDRSGLSGNKSSLNMQFGWSPQELFFLSRGAPPYLLAFGSGKLAAVNGARDTKMIDQALVREGDHEIVGRAELGEKIVLGGSEVLVVPPTPWPWKQWLLWIILILGVLIMAVMARNLIREVKSRDELE